MFGAAPTPLLPTMRHPSQLPTSYDSSATSLYLQQTERYLREVNKLAEQNRAAYFRSLIPRA